MPREGVPYPERMLCSLKCELKNIWNALNGKLHSVNGVEGDGQGNVTIVSENAALEVHDYPLQNQIGISLDTSQLPAANVDSVNGQTGVVALNADDIPSDGGSDVQADIDALKLADTTLQGNITAEATARGNADSALQTNINTVTASLPGAAAAAVAADPTIASLVTANSQNVKLSGNQSIGGIKTVSTEATGTYSSQIANSSKVKNELDSYATMVRTANAQTISGVKTFNDPPVMRTGLGGIYRFNSVANKYTRIAKITLPSTQTLCYLSFRATINDIRFTDIIIKSNTGSVNIKNHYGITTSHIFAIRTSVDGGSTMNTLELYYYRGVSNNFVLSVNQTNRDSIVTDASVVSYDNLSDVPDYYDTLTVNDLDA